MPRRVVECLSCEARFVARLLSSFECDGCCIKNGQSLSRIAGSETSGRVKRTFSGVGKRGKCNLNVRKIIEIISDEEEEGKKGEEGGNKAGDDWKCTQICHNEREDKSTSDGDGIDDKPIGEMAVPLVQLKKKQKQKKSNDNASSFPNHKITSSPIVGQSNDVVTIGQNSHGDTICLICGKSFFSSTSLKFRLDHIKRCSVKNGVSAKDVRWNDDHEMFVPSSPDPCLSALNITNPYAKNSFFCHPISSQVTGKASLPSINSVLMAGARKAAKIENFRTEAIATKKDSKQRMLWWQQQQQSRKNNACPWYKKIPNTDFYVDGFNYAAETSNFFLTHFHSDHYGGITKAWKSGTIYCSLITANLVNQQLGVDRKYLHPIPLLTPVIIESVGKVITVTLIDANHCPGAVMFLFQIDKKNVLHVGDFRWNRKIMQNQAPLLPFFTNTSMLDSLYLDTTYCDTKYTLPTQDVTIQAAIENATKEYESARISKKNILMLFGAYTIGKERIYMAVAKSLGLKVYVDSQRFRVLQQLNWTKDQMDILTTNPFETILWVVPLGHINMKQLPNYLRVQKGSFDKAFDRVVGFRPTGWSLSSNSKRYGVVTTTVKGKITVHGVPYSEHSSFPELLDCLRCLKPKRIVPTVSVSKSQQQIDLLLQSLSLSSCSSTGSLFR